MDDDARTADSESATSATTVIDGAPASSNGAPHVAPTPPPPPPAKRRRGGLAIALLALVMGFAGGVAGFAVSDQVAGDDAGDAASQSPFAPANDDDFAAEDAAAVKSGDALTPGAIYRGAGPAVVYVTAEVSVTGSSIFGFPEEQQGSATGSGFVIDDKGHIVTNAHVVENATSVRVSFSEDEEIEAEVVGQDISTDIAVLKIDVGEAKLEKALKAVSFGDSSAVTVGDPVVAIGNPFSLERTLTTGVVSALQRQIRAQNGFSIDDVIQTDAAINPGNSGGPLLNMRGEVIGVNSQIASKSGGNEGIGFAVPSNTVKRVAQQLISSGAVEHAWLGLAGTDVDADIAELFNLPVKEGVLVNVVTEGSPADKAGVEGGTREVIISGVNLRLGGSIVTQIDDEKVETMRELADYINTKEPGDEVELTFYDGGDKKTEEIKLGTRPDTEDATAADR